MKLLFAFPALLVALLVFSSSAQADKLCMRKRFKKPRKFLKVQETCPRAYVEVFDTDSFSGSDGRDGAQGPAGEDGSIRVYGDSSNGELIVSSNSTLAPDGNQYSNIVINAGQTLFVYSGSIVRCSGTFVNNGTVHVLGHASGAYMGGTYVTGNLMPSVSPAGFGLAKTAGSNGTFGDNSANLPGGEPGTFTNNGVFANVFSAPAGMGAGGGTARQGSPGGDGGGSFTVICAGSVTNNGVIEATGEDGSGSGSGGGGGGLIVLASKTSVTNAVGAELDVSGGDGRDSNTNCGAGGGGGGGFVHLIAPSVANEGTITTTGGVAGDNVINVAANPRFSGAGGGSSRGAGGGGGGVLTDGTPLSANNGSVGASLSTETDPTSLL